MPREVFVAGQILTAAEMNIVSDQTVMVFDDSAARTTAIPSPSEGMITYLKDTDALEKYTTTWESVDTAGILQLVSATDSTLRTTTSTSYVDANISISVTPKSASSTLIVGWSGLAYSGIGSSANAVTLRIADSDDNPLSGAEDAVFFTAADVAGNEVRSSFDLLAFVSAGSTNARTYKGRFRRTNGTASIANSTRTGRMFVMEVAG